MPSKPLEPKEIFNCQQCGECCKGYGGTFVTEKDIAKIAAHLNSDPSRFVENYCQLSGGKPVLSQAENGYCIFWDNKCRIHAVKPWMCRQWPFIESILIDIENWQIIGATCPGIRTDVPDEAIRKHVQKELGKNRKP